MTIIATLVTVTDDGAEDVAGNPTEQETSTTVRCELQQARRIEADGSENWQVGVWRLVLPAGTAVSGVDRIEIDDVSYEFDGPPWPVRNPRTGAVSHIEATVRQTT